MKKLYLFSFLLICLSAACNSSDNQNIFFRLPDGFHQQLVSDETHLNIYSGNDWNDMNTLNESGIDAGRYLYRTHEVRPRMGVSNFKGGAISVVDLKTSQAKILIQRKDWEAVDGIVWTPWNTLLINEEAQNAKLVDPLLPSGEKGHVYEVFLPPSNPSKIQSVHLREKLGALAHEGIEYDEEGNIYIIDEDYEGSIYKFTPEKYGDLSRGQLFALKLDNENPDRTGSASWIPLDMTIAINNAQKAAKKINATTWCRPEDLERIDNTLYVALTCHKNTFTGQRKENRVLSISLNNKPLVKNFVKEDINVPAEKNKAGFAKPDNLANGPDSTLWIVEDNSPSDIWVAYPDKNNDGLADKVELFATLLDKKAEATGIYFDKGFKNLYVSIQHSGSGNDKTIRIFKK